MTTRRYLAVEIGSKHTRAWLFDDASGSFELRECAKTLSSLKARGEVESGAHEAIRALQNKANLALFAGGETKLNFGDGGLSGAALTVSAGEPISTVLVGVSDTYSLATLNRLSGMFGCNVVLAIHQQDELNATAQLSRMIASDADLFIVAGGTNRGAIKPLKAAVDNIRIIYENMPRQVKPQVVYAGNDSYAPDATAAFEGSFDAHIAGNIQPEMGVEDPSIAWKSMLRAWRQVRLSQMSGLSEVEELLQVKALPSAFAMGRVVRLLDQMNPRGKGVMTVDLGQLETRLMAARGGTLAGLVEPFELSNPLIDMTYRFMSQPLEKASVEACLRNKRLLPDFIPLSIDDMAVEQAFMRARIITALEELAIRNPDFGYKKERGLIEPYEPIILLGEAFCQCKHAGQTMMAALDGFQPHGVTTFVLDQAQLTPALGALAGVEPMVAVQVIDSGIYKNLGTTAAVDSPEKSGRMVLEVEVDESQPERRRLPVRKGELKRLETVSEDKTRLYLSPTANSDVGMGMRGLGGWLAVSNSEVGVVIDARGRPIEIESDADARMTQITEWSWELSE